MKIEHGFDRTDERLAVIRAELIVVDHAIRNFKIDTLIRPITQDTAIERSLVLARFNQRRFGVLSKEAAFRRDLDEQKELNANETDARNALNHASQAVFLPLRSHVIFSAATDHEAAVAFRSQGNLPQADLLSRFSTNWMHIARALPSA